MAEAMSNDSGTGSQEDRQGSEREPELFAAQTVKDPYAILNVDRSVDDDTIQRAYKTLSRTFHPDKQPPGPSRDAAQESFIAFKNAHDILTDPVQRQVFDDHGSRGVELVKRSIHLQEKNPNALYAVLRRLHQDGEYQQARLLVKDALQHMEYQSHSQAFRVSASMEFPCSTVSTVYLGEGDEPLGIPELQGAHVSFAVTSSAPNPESRWSVTVGGTANVVNGKGDASGQMSVGYNPVQNTYVSADVDVNDSCKFAIGSTRKLTNGTVVTTKLSTIPNSRHLSILLMSQRALLKSNYMGTCIFGFGTDLSVQFYQLSCTTLWAKGPQFTAKCKLGDTHPIKLSAKQEFGSNHHKHTAHVSCATSLSSVEIKALVDHTLSSYATFSMGIQHATMSGLTWLFGIKRGDISFRIPINVSSINSSGYSYKVALLSFTSGLLHTIIRESVEEVLPNNDVPETNSGSTESSLRLNKSKQDAEQQKALMTKRAEASRVIEKSMNGLVILKASYFVQGGESMDVTTQLQFWVKDSRLHLPPTPKGHLLGFYSLNVAMHNYERPHHWWHKLVPRSNAQASPALTVRYKMKGRVYEVTVKDDEELVLPHPRALVLGYAGKVS